MPTPEKAPEIPPVKFARKDLIEAARSEAIRALSLNSVSAMTYDMIGDLVVTAARQIAPELDWLFVAEPLTRDKVVLPAYAQQDVVLFFDDPVKDLWHEDFVDEVIRAIRRLLMSAPNPAKRTLRGQLVRRPEATMGKFALVISVLNQDAAKSAEDNSDETR